MNSAGGRCHDNARCESMWARMKEDLRRAGEKICSPVEQAVDDRRLTLIGAVKQLGHRDRV